MKVQQWLVTVFLLGLMRTLSAQTAPPVSFEAAHQQALAENPPDVKFTLRLKDNKTQFHRGEIIRLELGFSSTRPKTYLLDAATYDRSGRMDEESFFLDPAEGAVDPLRRYFEGGRGIMGGLRSIPALAEKPYTLTLDLNEWRRFDKPGDYRLYVISNRVTDESGPRRTRRVASNLVTFTILPEDPAWSERTLQDALQVLDSKPAADAGGPALAHHQEKLQEASRVLRFLDTPEAAREMARRYGDRQNPGNFNFFFGIVASSHGALAMEQLHRRIADPDEEVSEDFMRLLTRLAVQLSRPEPLPPHPGPKNSERLKDWEKLSLERGQQMAALTADQWKKLMAALPEKRGKARVATLYTLANWDWGWSRSGNAASSTQYAAPLRSVFAELNPESQRTLLEYRWPAIKSPEMLPHLRRILATEFVGRELRDVAARRFWELSPAEARPLFLQEMANRLPHLSARTLTLLPDATLPQVEKSWAYHLENQPTVHTDLDALTALIERYATPAIAPRVKTVLLNHLGRWSCAPQEAMLAYFLRVEPSFAQDAIQKVLASRETGCRHSLFSNIARLEWRPELEELALAQINNPDVEIAIDAISALGKHGSTHAEAALWKRLEAWHAQWKNRPDEIEYRHARQNPHQAQSRLESALLEALAKSPAWLANNGKLQKIKSFMVSENARSEAGYLSERWKEPFSVSILPFEPKEYTVAHYRLKSENELKRKLAQFPKGTVFLWSPTGTDQEFEKRFEEELRAFLTPRSLTLETPQPDKN